MIVKRNELTWFERLRMLHAPLQLFEGVGGTSWARAEQHVRENQAERIKIGALVDGFPFGLLRRHVLDCSEDGARHGDIGRRSGRSRSVRHAPV